MPSTATPRHILQRECENVSSKSEDWGVLLRNRQSSRLHRFFQLLDHVLDRIES